MSLKKLAFIGVIALVVVGCVLAAGCTSTTTNNTTPAATTEDFAVGTWTLPNGTTVVFTNDFKGVMTTEEKAFNFTWKKTADGKYQVDREDGAQVIWTLDNVKGTMTNAAGNVLTKQTSDTSGGMITINLKDLLAQKTEITLDANGGEKNGYAEIITGTNNLVNSSGDNSFTKPEKTGTVPGQTYYCIGYYTAPTGGDELFDEKGKIANENLSPYTENGKWVYAGKTLKLYAHWIADLGDGFKGSSAKF